ncbi:alkaline phosphatase PhoX [Adhaeribacter aquaticus]|uniref:alkaline phosphatase PhoX n=1 Tax=Adhaeribacter aquaticus TaxID=299567 RepID=UPI00047AB3B0|nr:alkaline phosphatase PhoX [Adhaeribacter aquaticus]
MKKIYGSFLVAAMVSAGVCNQKVVAQSQKSAVAGVPNKNKIGSFISVKPTGQTSTTVIPFETHSFQLLAKSRSTTYQDGSPMPIGNDFTAYVGKNGSSKEGYLSINHENTPGGVSILDIHLDESANIWVVDAVRKVDFSPLVQTTRNCSGGITPWGTVITSEETTNRADLNKDGYEDVGWQVEIDPVTGKIMDYDGDGKPDKLWAMGRMSHENIAIGSDRKTIYQAEDGGSNGVYKFVADEAGNLSAGKLYVLKRDSETATTGTWVQVPNTTKADRNNTYVLGRSLGTNWRNPEDIEFGPDGKMYFTTKGTGDIWRFKDNGETVSEIEAWVTRQEYEIAYNGGTQKEDWGTGIDNLTFDNEGNLWALQDGGRDNVWVIRPEHTPENPKVELFMTSPAGSEPTGLTFSPDFKYGFISLQNASSGNTTVTKDAAGKDVVFNTATTIVFSRNQFLGKNGNQTQRKEALATVASFPNPFRNNTQVKVNMPNEAEALLEVYDMHGLKVETLAKGVLKKGEHVFQFKPAVMAENSMYLVRLILNGQEATARLMQAE